MPATGSGQQGLKIIQERGEELRGKGRNKEETLENYASTSISVQNMSLYAWSTGIGIHWSTGKPCKVEGLYSRLNIDQTFILVGCLYMGYIKSKNKLFAKPRASFEEKTIWL